MCSGWAFVCKKSRTKWDRFEKSELFDTDEYGLNQ